MGGKDKRSLNYSIWEGSFASGMVGFAESFFSAFAIFLQATSLHLGLLGSLPQLLGSFSQLLSTRLIAFFGNRKRFVITGIVLQALMIIPITLVFLTDASLPLLILFVCLYFIFGMIINPAWSSWMGDLVDENERGAYFGRRNRIVGLVLFASLLTAGFILQQYKDSQEALLGFIIIFAAAVIFRLASVIFFLKQHEPHYHPPTHRRKTFISFLRNAQRNNYGLLVLFLSSMNFAVAVAGPYFAAYMLNDLALSYWVFTIITAAAMISKYLLMPLWGRIADKYGARRVLTLTAVLLPTVPVIWLWGTSVPYLIVIQLWSGVVWAGFEIASFKFLLDATHPEERSTLLAYYNVTNGVFVFVGALIGALLVKYEMPMNSYLFLFLLSGVLRGIVTLLFVFRLKEVRSVQRISYTDMVFEALTIQPNLGVTYQVSVIKKELIEPFERGTWRVIGPIVRPMAPYVSPIIDPIRKAGEEMLPLDIVADAAELPMDVLEETVRRVQREPRRVARQVAEIEDDLARQHGKDVRKIKRKLRKTSRRFGMR